MRLARWPQLSRQAARWGPCQLTGWTLELGRLRGRLGFGRRTRPPLGITRRRAGCRRDEAESEYRSHGDQYFTQISVPAAISLSSVTPFSDLICSAVLGFELYAASSAHTMRASLKID